MRGLVTTGIVLALAASAFARIDYTIRIAEGTDAMSVEMVIPSDGKAVQVQMPNWAPGSYRLVDNFKFIDDVSAMRASRRVSVNRVDDNTWEIGPGSSGDIVLKYQRKTGPITNRMHITGPAYYLYVKDRIAEDCTVNYEMPEKWRATCGLEEKDGKFVAPTYDVLADNPVTVGIFESDFYETNGIKYEIAYFGGDVSTVDRATVVDYCKRVSDSLADFWSGVPFKKYVWHFTVMPGNDGGWGLEHLSSTTMGIARGVGPGTVSVIAHEHFHAWNVKRIRSKVLGPFNYLELPKTGALWLLEGVTDYYADLLLYRYDIFDEEYMRGNVVTNVRTTRANPQRFEVSPYDSSYRVSEAANGRGNSAGFGVNYYNTGWLVGLCLDTEIRDLTGGRKSLDDVMYKLFAMTKDDQPGFEEDDVRKVLIEVGGAAMGPFYDKVVMTAGELPVEAQLAKLGYKFETKTETFVDLGFSYVWGQDDRLAVPRRSRDGQYLANDEIVEINGIKKPTDSTKTKEVWDQWKKLMVKGAKLKIVLERGEERLEREVEVKEGTTTNYVLTDMDGVSDGMKSLRKGWYQGAR